MFNSILHQATAWLAVPSHQPLAVLIPFVLIVLGDWVAGVLISILKGQFSWEKLPMYLETSVPGKQLAVLLTAVIAVYFTEGQAGAWVAVAALVASGGAMSVKISADFLSKVNDLIPLLIAKLPFKL